jgi:hypothetical protein
MLLIIEHNGDVSSEKNTYEWACTKKNVNTEECFEVQCVKKWKKQPVNNPFGF